MKSKGIFKKWSDNTELGKQKMLVTTLAYKIVFTN